MKIENNSDVRRQYVRPAAKVIEIKTQQVLCQSFGTEAFEIFGTEYNDWND